MALIVQKFGGSSVADAESIRRVARRIVETKAAGHDVVVYFDNDAKVRAPFDALALTELLGDIVVRPDEPRPRGAAGQ